MTARSPEPPERDEAQEKAAEPRRGWSEAMWRVVAPGMCFLVLTMIFVGAIMEGGFVGTSDFYFGLTLSGYFFLLVVSGAGALLGMSKAEKANAVLWGLGFAAVGSLIAVAVFDLLRSLLFKLHLVIPPLFGWEATITVILFGWSVVALLMLIIGTLPSPDLTTALCAIFWPVAFIVFKPRTLLLLPFVVGFIRAGEVIGGELGHPLTGAAVALIVLVPHAAWFVIAEDARDERKNAGEAKENA